MLDLDRLSTKQQQLVQLLQAQSFVPSLRQLCQSQGLDFNFAKGFLLSGLLDPYVQLQELTEDHWELTPKGQALDGIIPGFPLVAKLSQGITDSQTLQAQLGAAFSLHYGVLRKEQAVDLQSIAPSPLSASATTAPDDRKTIQLLNPAILEIFQQRQAGFSAIATSQNTTQDATQNSPSAPVLEASVLAWLVQESLIVEKQIQDYAITVAPSLRSIEIKPSVTTLTSEMLLSGQWRSIDFKPYDIHDAVPPVAYGRPTILTQCIQRIRTIFLEMGFDEMSGYIVESAFWNFDALFTPQDHPAREIQDTFYLANPQTLPMPEDTDLIQQVKQVHERSYSGTWTEVEASRAILRAHTTTSTARKLHQLQGKDGKYFSIDKVFRNETVDRTHLAEFHQIEGVVIGELLSVRTLMGYLTYFYGQLGFQHLKFKPTYNPYTEPSLEVYAYHVPSQKYLEVGNSGLFRTEMLEPLGCAHKSTVAWGLGLERIAMLLYNVEKLSDLVGADITIDR